MDGSTSILNPAQEDELLVRLRDGSRAARDAAFAELVSHFRRPLLGMCLNLTGDPADAEDALQDVLLAVHRGLRRFRGEARLSTWIYRIAVRVALRVKSHRRSHVPLDQDLPAPRNPDPVARRERAQQIHRAVARLPAEHRVVLTLFAVRGLRHREIAEVVGIPEGTVWSRLHHARRKLAAELGDVR